MGIKNKKNYFQIIRGICIVAVVLIHCPNGFRYLGSGEWSLNTVYYFLIRNLINFPVPIFLFMAGYFVNEQKVRDNPCEFYKGRFKRLVIPYLIWSTIYNGWTCIYNYTAGIEISIKELLFTYVVGSAATPLYYLVILIFLSAITPLILRMSDNKILSRCMLGGWIVLIGINTLTQLGIAPSIPLMSIIIQNFIMYVFYVFGLFAKRNKEPIATTLNTLPVVPMVIIALLFQMAECFIFTKQNMEFAFSQIRLGGFVYSFSLILLIVKYKDREWNNKLLIYLGDSSFSIYFIHCIFIEIIRYFVKNIPILPLEQAVFLIGALLLCSGTISCSRVITGIIGNKLKKSSRELS